MNYTPVVRDDFDKSFRYKKHSFLCYSEKKLKELFPNKDYKVIGLARKTDKDTEDKLILGNKSMPVYDAYKNSILYRSIGFVPIDDGKKYIAVQESAVPFFTGIFSMVATTAVICCIVLNTKPTITIENIRNESTPKFNPLPPVDSNIEDYVDDSGTKTNNKKKAPENGGRVAISYKSRADINLDTSEVKMEYQNPDTSSHDAVVSLYVVSDDEEYLIANSGRIPSGKQLKTMQLNVDKDFFGGEGKYNAEYRVAYYNHETGERALTEATIDDIDLIVRK